MDNNIKKAAIIELAVIINYAGNVLIYLLSFYLVCNEITRHDIFVHLYPIFLGLYCITFLWLSHVYNAYSVGESKISELIYSLSLSSIISSCLLYIVQTGYLRQISDIIFFIALLAGQFIWNVLWTFVTNKLYFSIHKPKKTVLIYRNKKDLQKLEEVNKYKLRFQIIKYIENPMEIHQLIKELESCDCENLFIAGIPATFRNGIAKFCIENNVQAYINPKIGDVIMAGAIHMKMFSVPILRIRRVIPRPEYLLIKRALDIILSLIAIVLSSPFMVLTALAIKLYDGGPILYKQVRLTKNKKQFKILKFRSMRVDAEKDGVARLSSVNDDRITPIGKLIRAIRFDELPQLFNILGGSMTIVGPRPERPEISAQYERDMSSFALRLQVKAGLTGYAQVYGRYNTEPYHKLQMDLMYINEMSLVQDLWLMFATVKILIMKDSTCGIAEGQTTAHK